MLLIKKQYESQFDINGTINARIRYLEEKRIILENEFSKMPEGNLLVLPGSTRNSFRYYLRKTSREKLGTYLDKNRNKDKEKYARKKYIKTLIKNIDAELQKLEEVNMLHLSDSIIDTYVDLNPGVAKLIDPINVDDETYAQMWITEKYERLAFDKDDSTAFYSDKNERMRSKSEVLIANALYRMKIPYKYEQPVKRKNGELLYPDFTVLDIKRRRIVYWEHLGKMDDMSYVSRNMWKLTEYKKLGIYLGVNLFVTYETSNCSVGTDDIQMIVKQITGM